MSCDSDTLLLHMLLSSYRRLFERSDKPIGPDPHGQAFVATTVEPVGRREFTYWISTANVFGVSYASGVAVPVGLYTSDEANALATRMQEELLKLVQTHDWSNAPLVTDGNFEFAKDQLDYFIEKSS